jgi:alpha-1,2-mannosyltransferase
MATARSMTARPVMLAGLAAGAGATAVALRALRSPAVDLGVFRAGGAAALGGAPVYDGPVSAGLDFTYPPLAALLFVPLAILPFPVAQALVTCINLAALGIAVWLSLTALHGRTLAGLLPLAMGLLFWMEPVRTSVYLGQVNLILLVLVLWDLQRGDRLRSKGIGVGVAAGIKLTPLIFVPYLLVTRRFRAASVATATFFGTVLLGFLLLPGDAARYWLTGMFADASRVYPTVASPHNQSLHGMLARLGIPDAAWLPLAMLTAAATIGVAAWASRRNEELLALTLCGLCAAVVTPHSWGHHWVWLAPLAVFLAHLATTRLRWPRHAPWLFPALLLPLTVPWVVDLANPPTGQPVLATGAAAFLLVNIYVVLFLGTVVASVCHLRGVRRAAPSISWQQAAS